MSLPENIFYMLLSAGLLIVLTAPPGLLALRALGFDIRRAVMLPLGIAAGMLLVPLLLNTVGQVFILGPWGRLALVAVLSLGLGLLRPAPPLPTPVLSARVRRGLFLLSVLAAAWVLLPLARHGTPLGAGWQATKATDWVKHSGVVISLSLSDQLPPPNYFLHSEPALNYYYFAYILPGLVDRLTAASAFQSFAGMALITAACLPVLIVLCGRAIGLSEQGALWAAAVAWGVGGLDALFSLFSIALAHLAPGDVDFWTKLYDRPILALSKAFVWLPQHAAALLGVLLVLWLIQLPLNRRLGIAIAALLAAVLGTSVQVWMGGCALLAVLAGVRMLRREVRGGAALALILLLGLLFGLPFLLAIRGRDVGAALQVSVSSMGALGPFRALLGQTPLANTLDFPIQMGIEFGAVLAMAWAALRRTWWAQRAAQEVAAGLAALFVMLLLLRDSPATNNYAQELALLVWALLALLAGAWWDRRSKRLSPLLGAALVLGVLTAVYGEISLLVDVPRVDEDRFQLYRWLDQNLSPADVYQIGLERSSNAPAFVEHWVALADDDLHVATLYARQHNDYVRVVRTLQQAYATADPAAAREGFERLGVDVVVSSPGDPLTSRRKPAFEQSFALVYRNPTYEVYRVGTRTGER